MQGLFGGGGQSAHVVFVGLRGVLGIFAFAVEGIFGDGGGEDAFFAVYDGDANVESTEVYARYYGHIGLLVILLCRRGFAAQGNGTSCSIEAPSGRHSSEKQIPRYARDDTPQPFSRQSKKLVPS